MSDEIEPYYAIYDGSIITTNIEFPLDEPPKEILIADMTYMLKQKDDSKG